jgi:hypothetical protein
VGWGPDRRNEQGRVGHYLWAIKPITWLDLDDCDDSDDSVWDFDFDPDPADAACFNCGSA